MKRGYAHDSLLFSSREHSCDFYHNYKHRQGNVDVGILLANIQFEILKHRLQKMMISMEDILVKRFLNRMTDKTNKLSEHVCHHLIIIRFVKQL